VIWTSQCDKASLGWCVATVTHDSDYPCPLHRQCLEGSYRSLRRYTQGLANLLRLTVRYTRQGLASWLGKGWLAY